MIEVNGEYIHGEFFTHLFYEKPQVTQFQLIQEDEHRLRLLVVSREQPSLNDIVQAIHQRVGDNVKIDIEMVAEIPPSPSGKYRFTVSRLRENK